MNLNYLSIINNISNKLSNFIDMTNKIIPIYNEAKPIIDSFNKIKNNIKNYNFDSLFKHKNDVLKETKKEELIYSSPQFFQ